MGCKLLFRICNPEAIILGFIIHFSTTDKAALQNASLVGPLVGDADGGCG